MTVPSGSRPVRAPAPARASSGAGRDTDALQRQTLRVLLASQVLAGAGLAAGVTVGGLLAEDMLGSTGLAGLPSALLTLGAAGAAVGVGRLSQHAGRRPGLAAGYAVGAIGGALVVLAAALDDVPLLLLALLLYGSGAATNLQARYAGADLSSPRAPRPRRQHRAGRDDPGGRRRTEPRPAHGRGRRLPRHPGARRAVPARVRGLRAGRRRRQRPAAPGPAARRPRAGPTRPPSPPRPPGPPSRPRAPTPPSSAWVRPPWSSPSWSWSRS
jgi:hypothetical protein